MRVLLVGKHLLLLQGLLQVLREEADVAARLTARPAEIAQGLEEWQPDAALIVALSDSEMLALVEEIQAVLPALPLLVIGEAEPESFLLALRAGARGFIGKDAHVEALIASLRTVQRGEWALPRQFLAHLVAEYLSLAGQRARDAVVALADRERQILVLLAQGMNARRVGEIIYRSESAVRADIRGLCRKLGVDNRVQAVAEALRQGWIQLDG